MALLQCPECGKEISDRADRCIHCGYPLKGRRRPVMILMAVLVTVIVVMAAFCGVRFAGRGMGLSLPYGLKEDMSPRQLHEQMQARGFVPDFEDAEGDRLEFIYQPAQVHGQEAYMTVLSTATGLVEVVGTLLGFFAVSLSSAVLPFALAFAGGTMLYVISDEMIPETHAHGCEQGATYSLLTGFCLMLVMSHFLG